MPKEGPEKFRFTVDLRPVNAQTRKKVWPMSHADTMLAKLTGAKTFFQLDFIHEYWQFPLSKDSQECQSFHTPFGVFTPRRVLPRIPFRTSNSLWRHCCHLTAHLVSTACLVMQKITDNVIELSSRARNLPRERSVSSIPASAI